MNPNAPARVLGPWTIGQRCPQCGNITIPEGLPREVCAACRTPLKLVMVQRVYVLAPKRFLGINISAFAGAEKSLVETHWLSMRDFRRRYS